MVNFARPAQHYLLRQHLQMCPMREDVLFLRYVMCVYIVPLSPIIDNLMIRDVTSDGYTAQNKLLKECLQRS